MSDEELNVKVVFADSFFDSLNDQDLTQEEQQEIITELGERMKDPVQMAAMLAESTELSDEEWQELVDTGAILEDDEQVTTVELGKNRLH